MEIIQIAGYSLAGGLLGYGLPQLGWDLAQRQNGHSKPETMTPSAGAASEGSATLQERTEFDLKRPAG